MGGGVAQRRSAQQAMRREHPRGEVALMSGKERLNLRPCCTCRGTLPPQACIGEAGRSHCLCSHDSVILTHVIRMVLQLAHHLLPN